VLFFIWRVVIIVLLPFVSVLGVRKREYKDYCAQEEKGRGSEPGEPDG
jgi:hypothetical protein